MILDPEDEAFNELERQARGEQATYYRMIGNWTEQDRCDFEDNVDMKRSTKMAPDSLSTSYLIGSECIEISITTLKSFGKSLPEGTRSRPTANSFDS